MFHIYNFCWACRENAWVVSLKCPLIKFALGFKFEMKVTYLTSLLKLQGCKVIISTMFSRFSQFDILSCYREWSQWNILFYLNIFIMRKPHHITLVINIYNVKLLKLPTLRLATSKIIAQAYYGRNSRFLLKDQRNYFMTSYIKRKTAIIFRQKPPKTCCFLIFIPMFNTKAIFAMWSTSFKFCLFSTSCVRIHWFNFGNIFFQKMLWTAYWVW